MEEAAGIEEHGNGPIGPAFMMRVFYAFAALAILSLAISVGGKWLGRSIATAGHTEDTALHEIVIGNNVLSVPANAIRFERARRDGIAERLDLYLRWPDLGGYSQATRDDFNHRDGTRNILFLTFEEPMMSRDMSDRFEPIYRSMIEPAGVPGEAGLTLHRFKQSAGYEAEMLTVAARAGRPPYVARCLEGAAAVDSLASCVRDVRLGRDLSLTYRFPNHLLAEWEAVDAAVMQRVETYLKTGR